MKLLLRLSECTAANLLKRRSIHCCQNRTYWVKSSTLQGPRKRQKYIVTRPMPLYHFELVVTSPLPCIRLGEVSAPRHLWRQSTHRLNCYSTSTDSRPVTQDGIDGKAKDNKTKIGKNLMPVPSEDIRRLLQLAHPERWRLTSM